MAILLDSVLKVVEAQVSEMPDWMQLRTLQPTQCMYAFTGDAFTNLLERRIEETKYCTLVFNVFHELLEFC